jgi:hypothetical protein
VPVTNKRKRTEALVQIRTHRAAPRIVRRRRGGVSRRLVAAVCLALAAAGATVADATPGQPRGSALVMHERVAKPGTYRVTIELWTLSGRRDTVVLRVADKTHRVKLARGQGRLSVKLRVTVSHRKFTIAATSVRRGSKIRLAVLRISGPVATTSPSAPTPAPSGSTGPTVATGTSGSTPPSQSETPSGEAMPVGNIPGWNQTYAQDFSGLSLPSGWLAYTGEPGGDPAGWWDPSHVSVSGGELRILSSRDPAHCPSGCTALDDFVSGGLQLYGHAQTYGKYEIRMRADNAKGLGLTVLLWPTDNWPPEIDMVADVGLSPRVGTAVGTIVYGSSNNPSVIGVKNTTADLTQWHTWGAEWTQGKVVFTLDGNVWATVTNPGISSVPMNLAIQMQAYPCDGIGGEAGCPDSSTPTSSDFDIDWVTQYSPS